MMNTVVGPSDGTRPQPKQIRNVIHYIREMLSKDESWPRQSYGSANTLEGWFSLKRLYGKTWAKFPKV
jgi:hypothetical protein